MGKIKIVLQRKMKRQCHVISDTTVCRIFPIVRPRKIVTISTYCIQQKTKRKNMENV